MTSNSFMMGNKMHTRKLKEGYLEELHPAEELKGGTTTSGLPPAVTASVLRPTLAGGDGGNFAVTV